ncbi:putative protein phosphatase 2C 35 isoform X2 [Apium graveolens]|uniref:putative protein phosphatase 2C 35 isoform X2 n=1 Tax=Apium graveolens TaxID=4045 RepID=UPI003D7A1B2F
MGCVCGKCCSGYELAPDGHVSSLDGSDYKDSPDHGQGKHVSVEKSLEPVLVPSHNFQLDYVVLTQRGYYPYMLDKENQDTFCVRTCVQGNPSVHFFGVFDGHGQTGGQCANFVKNRLVENLSRDSTLVDDPINACNAAFLATNDELHDSEIDDSLSGTTAVTVLVVGDMLYVANVGDSRAVIAVKKGDQLVDLSSDQTPFRRDECERVKVEGARVLSVDQVEGLKDPSVQTWGDEETEGGDPPRLWVQNAMYPGTAFTRSVGDSVAEKIGVFVVASDGVFEFLSSQTVVDMVDRQRGDACYTIAGESYRLWLQFENRTDDITLIIVHIEGLSNV